MSPPRLDRRRFLAGALATVAGAACDGQRPKAGYLGLMERVNERLERSLFDPDRLAKELPPEAATPRGAFPAYKISRTFPVPPAGWRLVVGGLVAQPLSLSVEDLQRLPRVNLRVRHHCVEGWSAVASWHGARLADVARAAGADPRAPYVEFRSFDSGYWSSWDRESALHRQTILAYGMDGAPLGPEHGAPVRLYAGVKLGYKMVKYLTEIRFLPTRTGGYWEDQGYEWFAGV